MTYPSNSDSVAQDQVRSFVDRILRTKEEARQINADIREVYAEAKGNGFDKTVLGKLVNYVEKRTASSTELAEAEALFDLYLSAYDKASGTKIATHAHETNPAPPPLSAADAGSASHAALPATQSPDDDGVGPAEVGGRAPFAGTGGDADRQLIPPETVARAVPAGIPVITIAAGGDAVETPATIPSRPVHKWKHSDRPHPDCLNPEQCGGFSNLGLCQRCKQAAGIQLDGAA